MKAFDLFKRTGEWNMIAFAIGIVSLLILIALRLIKTKYGKTERGKYLVYIPDPLVVVSIGIILSSSVGLKGTVPILGRIQTGLVAPVLPRLVCIIGINLAIRSSASRSRNPLLTGVPVPLEMEASRLSTSKET